MSERSPRLSRRNFLLSVGAGGAATAAAIVAKTSSETPAAVAATGKRPSRGYQVTEHVNNYYRTTKV
ncbi:MAG TPA: formate dehydrogenase [Burkholderiales bacterium]|nr:formate dehydrogenase [Burkholderiales bacterium]